MCSASYFVEVVWVMPIVLYYSTVKLPHLIRIISH